MPFSRSTSRAVAHARRKILAELRSDHTRLKKAYRDFQKLDFSEDADACQALVQQVVDGLTAHAAIEEELLYPAARAVIADAHLVDQAEVEHEMLVGLTTQLRQMSAFDARYVACFRVLCEYMLQHMKQEEDVLLPQLHRAELDWQGLAQEIDARRQELLITDVGEDSGPEVALVDLSDGEPRPFLSRVGARPISARRSGLRPM
jgi:hemerythrin superfamily protein